MKPLKLLSVVLMLRRLQGEGEIFVCSALMCGLIRCEVSAFVLMHLHCACVCVCVYVYRCILRQMALLCIILFRVLVLCMYCIVCMQFVCV